MTTIASVDAMSGNAGYVLGGGQYWQAQGYWCSCGMFIPDGHSHSCFGFGGSFHLEQPKTTPHKCPVCEGRGAVQFNPDKPLSRRRGQFQCKPCSGTGVLWG